MGQFDEVNFRMNPIWSQIFFGVGIGCAVLGLIWALIDGFLSLNGMPIILLAAGVKFPVWGFIYRSISMHSLFHDRFEIKNMYGMVWRTIHFGNIQELKLDRESGNVLYDDKGKEKTIKHLKRSRVHPEDWERMANWVETGVLEYKSVKK